jgi:hypothetical protein
MNAQLNWWPASDEEWERLNFPERFKQHKEPVDKKIQIS